MSEFTERLRDYAENGDNGPERMIEAADIIDEMTEALRICANAFEYLGIDENQITFYAPTAIREALEKLERAGS